MLKDAALDRSDIGLDDSTRFSLSVGYVSGYVVSFWMLGYSTGSFPGMLMGLMSLDD